MATPSSPARTALGVLLAVGVAGIGYIQSRTAAELSALRIQAADRSTAEAAFRATVQETLDRMTSEITRMRIEQRVGGQGPQALMEMLRTHADTLVNARATAPDFHRRTSTNCDGCSKHSSSAMPTKASNSSCRCWKAS